MATDVMPSGGLSQDGQSEQSQRPAKTFIERLHKSRCSCFEYYLHVHMHVCGCVQMIDWPGLNSAKTARLLNISGEAQTRQSRQWGFLTKPQFYLSNVHEIKRFPRYFTECLHSISI